MTKKQDIHCLYCNNSAGVVEIPDDEISTYSGVCKECWTKNSENAEKEKDLQELLAAQIDF